MKSTLEKKYAAKALITINAPVAEVWNALTNPAFIKQYLHGTEAISDWKVGSTLEFKGEWKGKPYHDKGVILKKEREKLFQYSWLSSNSGLEDVEENYSIITYDLFPDNNQTQLMLTQENIPTEESKKQSEQNWKAVLETLKKILEKNKTEN